MQWFPNQICHNFLDKSASDRQTRHSFREERHRETAINGGSLETEEEGRANKAGEHGSIEPCVCLFMAGLCPYIWTQPVWTAWWAMAFGNKGQRLGVFLLGTRLWTLRTPDSFNPVPILHWLDKKKERKKDARRLELLVWAPQFYCTNIKQEGLKATLWTWSIGLGFF